MASATTSPSGTAMIWNAGGWFGAQIGSTLWMAILGLALLSRDGVAAATALVAFAAVNALGWSLWSRRARLAAYPAVQALLAGLTVAMIAVVAVAHARGVAGRPEEGVAFSTWLPIWVIALPPVMMLVFHLRERRARGTADVAGR